MVRKKQATKPDEEQLDWRNLRKELHAFLDNIAANIIQRVPEIETLSVNAVEELLIKTLPQLPWRGVEVYGPIFESAFTANPSFYASELHRRFQAAVSKPPTTVFKKPQGVNLLVADGAASAASQFGSLDETTLKSVFMSKAVPASLILRAYEIDKQGTLPGSEAAALKWAKRVSNLLLADSHDVAGRIRIFMQIISPLVNDIYEGKIAQASVEATYKVMLGFLSLCSLQVAENRRGDKGADELSNLKTKLLACFLRVAVLLEESSASLASSSLRASKDFGIIISLSGAHNETQLEELTTLLYIVDITLPTVIKNRGGNGLIHLLIQHLISLLSKVQLPSTPSSSAYAFLRLVVVLQRALILYGQLKENSNHQKASVALIGLQIPESLVEWCTEYGVKHAVKADDLKSLSVDYLRAILKDLGAPEIDKEIAHDTFFEDKGMKKQEPKPVGNQEVNLIKSIMQDAILEEESEDEVLDNDADSEHEQSNRSHKRKVLTEANGNIKRMRAQPEESEDEEQEQEEEIGENQEEQEQEESEEEEDVGLMEENEKPSSFVKASELPIPFTPPPLESFSLPSSTPTSTPHSAAKTSSTKPKTPLSNTPLPSSKTPRSIAKTPQQPDGLEEIETTTNITQNLNNLFKGMKEETTAVPESDDEMSSLDASLELEAEREEAELEDEADKLEALEEANVDKLEAEAEREAEEAEKQVEKAAGHTPNRKEKQVENAEAEEQDKDEEDEEEENRNEGNGTQPFEIVIESPQTKKNTKAATPRVIRRTTRSQAAQSPLPQPPSPPAATPTRKYTRRGVSQTPQPTKPTPSITRTTVKKRKNEVADLQASAGRLGRMIVDEPSVSTPVRRSARILKQ